MRKLALFLIAIPVLYMLSCDDKKETHVNPLLGEWDTAFGMPPFADIKPSDYKPAFLEAIEVHYAEIDSIIRNEAEPDFQNVIVALDQSGMLLNRVSRVFSLLVVANNNEKLQEVEIEMSPILTAHYDNIYLNSRLFEKIRTVYDARSSSGLDDMQMRLLEKTYKNFVRAGAGLDQENKDKLMAINSELARAQIEFGNNLLADGNNFVMMIDSVDIEGLPRSVTDAAAEKANEMGDGGRYAFTLKKPSLIPFLTYSPREDLREVLYKGYINQGNNNDSTDNKSVINDIMRLRSERASILGYSNYAEYVLEERMAKDASEVYALLEELWTPSLETAKKELEELRAIKKAETGSERFEAWDWWYYAEKVRKQKYDLDEDMILPYFSLPSVQAGIFDLSNRLYGVTFRPVNLPVYNKECVTFEVLDIDNTHLGILLLDMYQRDNKRAGAWCASYRGRQYVNGEKVSDPIVTIVCNFTRPSGSKPALLNLDETETFFHEFGHALHALFTDVKYNGLQRTEQDFIELPSQIMENWAFEPAMLRRYALHYASNKAIPDDLIEKIVKSSQFNQGFLMTEHLAAALSDMDIHTIPNYKSLNLNNFETEILDIKRGLIPEIAPRYRFPYFSHIFSGGYAAGYYSYKWSEVLDKDAFEAFAETGDLFNRKVAEAFRKEILSQGGSADGMTLYRNFRGREPRLDYLMYARGLKERPANMSTDIFPQVGDIEDMEDTTEDAQSLD